MNKSLAKRLLSEAAQALSSEHPSLAQRILGLRQKVEELETRERIKEAVNAS